MKIVIYILTVVSEEHELPMEEVIGSSDVVNEEMCVLALKKIEETWIPFEERTEKGEETGSWYEKWYSRAGDVLDQDKEDKYV